MSWDELLACSGVARQQIDEVAAAVAQARSGVFMWAMGLTHHALGRTTSSLLQISLARGFLGRQAAVSRQFVGIRTFRASGPWGSRLR